MGYTVCPAQLPDLGRIQEIYGYAREFMAKHGNPNQWGKTYPPIEQVRRDIAEEKLFVITDGQRIHGVFYFWIGQDPTYRRIDGAWRSDSPYGTIHRIAGDGSGGRNCRSRFFDSAPAASGAGPSDALFCQLRPERI